MRKLRRLVGRYRWCSSVPTVVRHQHYSLGFRPRSVLHTDAADLGAHFIGAFRRIARHVRNAVPRVTLWELPRHFIACCSVQRRNQKLVERLRRFCCGGAHETLVGASTRSSSTWTTWVWARWSSWYWSRTATSGSSRSTRVCRLARSRKRLGRYRPGARADSYCAGLELTTPPSRGVHSFEFQ